MTSEGASVLFWCLVYSLFARSSSFARIDKIVVPVVPYRHERTVSRARKSKASSSRSRCSKLASTAASSFSSDLLAPGIAAIDAANDELNSLLHVLREKDFFRFYSCDLLGSCEYIPQELFECYSETCEIYPVDEEEVPEAIREVDSAEFDFELDGWARWDMPSEDYYDTTQFPEEYTGYDGSDVWNFIHDRICFHDDNNSDHWKADFNQAVSGLHAMISAQVVKGMQDKIHNGEDMEQVSTWTLDPKTEFHRRLSPYMQDLYFGFILILSAVALAKPRFLHDCDSDKIHADAASDLRHILDLPIFANPIILHDAPKQLRHHATNQNSLWEARMRTRELMRIMNCVQCNKCRFHGKISVFGLSTALQILLGQTGHGADTTRLHRVELAALITTMSKFSTALHFCQTMISSSSSET